jgi:2'-5' RNA ligase
MEEPPIPPDVPWRVGLLWRVWAAARLARSIDPAEADPDAPARFLTCVMRLPPDAAAELRALTRELERVQPAHHYYPPDAMHLTIAIPGGTGPLEDGAGARSADLDRLARELAPVRLAARGLAPSPTTLFAALVTPDVRLDEAMRRLRAGWHSPSRPLPMRLLLGRIRHVNVVRYREPPSAAFLAAARELRHWAGTPFVGDTFELVRTNTVLAAARTTILERVALGAQPT